MKTLKVTLKQHTPLIHFQHDQYGAILQAMWIWNDYLLPYLVLDLKTYKTIPMAIQYLKGGYGQIDMGAMMAMLVLAMIPIIAFYLACQKYIIEGVIAGAVKG